MVPRTKLSETCSPKSGTELDLLGGGMPAPFPFSPHRVPKLGPSAKPMQPPRRPGVLVVDDTEAVRSMLVKGLEHYGFIVWSADSGQRACELYRDHGEQIAAVLLDVQMPHLDGPGTLFALQELNPTILCCFMSANPTPYTEDDLLQLGALTFIKKPFRLEQVAQLLQALLDFWSTARFSIGCLPVPSNQLAM